MISLAGTLGLMIIVILLGKGTREINSKSYYIIGIIAILQVAIVIFIMYTMQPPEL